MSRFAAHTETPIGNSEAELRRTILQYGGDDVGIAQSKASRQAMIQFRYRGLTLEARIPLPDPNEPRFTLTPTGKHKRAPSEAAREYEQACRQQWRVLLLLCKAKLEAVENGFPVEEEFLSWILLPSRGDAPEETVGKAIRGKLKEALATGTVRGILTAGPAKKET